VGNARHVVLTPASEISVRAVHWLWEDRIPLGELTLLAGREGLGKSTIAYTLAGWLSRGSMKGRFYGKPRSVFVAATEDSWEHTIGPRLIAAGADLSRIFRIDVQTGDAQGSLDLPVDIDSLKLAVKESEPAMILLDPLLSRLSSNLDSHKDADVRVALEPLTAFAKEMRVAILGIIHVNKSNSADALNAVMGSRAFTAVARAVLMVVKNPEDDSCLFGLAKNNLGPKSLPAYRYRIGGVNVGEDDEGDDVTTGRVEWDGSTDRSIDDVMGALSEGGMNGVSQTEEAASWLEDYLTMAGGSKESKIVKDAGIRQGHSERTLRRAAEKLKVQVTQSGFPRTTIWTICSEATGEAVS
jgi:energy-coupling factor transporter ATP-binding protein EcfA2